MVSERVVLAYQRARTGQRFEDWNQKGLGKKISNMGISAMKETK